MMQFCNPPQHGCVNGKTEFAIYKAENFGFPTLKI